MSSKNEIIIAMDTTGIHGTYVKKEHCLDKQGYFYPVYIPSVSTMGDFVKLILKRNREVRYPHPITEAQFIESKKLISTAPGAVEQVIHILPVVEDDLNRINDFSSRINSNYIKLSNDLAEARHIKNIANTRTSQAIQENEHLNKKSNNMTDEERRRRQLMGLGDEPPMDNGRIFDD